MMDLALMHIDKFDSAWLSFSGLGGHLGGDQNRVLNMINIVMCFTRKKKPSHAGVEPLVNNVVTWLVAIFLFSW